MGRVPEITTLTGGEEFLVEAFHIKEERAAELTHHIINIFVDAHVAATQHDADRLAKIAGGTTYSSMWANVILPLCNTDGEAQFAAYIYGQVRLIEYRQKNLQPKTSVEIPELKPWYKRLLSFLGFDRETMILWKKLLSKSK